MKIKIDKKVDEDPIIELNDPIIEANDQDEDSPIKYFRDEGTQIDKTSACSSPFPWREESPLDA